MRLLLANLIDNIANIRLELIFRFKYYFYKDFRITLNFNKKFKNIYKNKKCFIAGNGPSLKELDLSKLNKEIVFTVNEIMSNKLIYNAVNSDFHVMIDPYYFNLSLDLPEDRATIERLKRINYENKKPTVITSYEGKNAFVKYGLDKILNLHYVYQHKYLMDSYSSSISMNKNMPNSLNVVQAAINSAIYMGFTEIYLIGCDMTFVFLTYENNNSSNIKNIHAYDYSDNQKTSISNFCSQRDNEFNLNELAKTFAIYKKIRKYAEKRGIKIINATKGGGLDVFERAVFESLF